MRIHGNGAKGSLIETPRYTKSARLFDRSESLALLVKII